MSICPHCGRRVEKRDQKEHEKKYLIHKKCPPPEVSRSDAGNLSEEQLENIYRDFILPGVKSYYQRIGIYPDPKGFYKPDNVPKLTYKQLQKLIERAVNEMEAGGDEKKASEGK